MPLQFYSISHGTVAFGFFNIDSDMLLLEQYFLFATRFCEYISQIVETDDERPIRTTWEVYHIVDPGAVGDLMGGIHGVRYTGFIGEVYRKFPFPSRPEDFKQKPEGLKNRAVIEPIIEKYARRIEIPFVTSDEGREIGIGPYKFTKGSFHELIRYVWRGGYPRWRNEIRPDYVMAMRKKIGGMGNKLFKGLILD